MSYWKIEDGEQDEKYGQNRDRGGLVQKIPKDVKNLGFSSILVQKYKYMI